MNISFNGCGNEIATFMTDEKLEKGSLVCISDIGKVSNEGNGRDFLGCVVSSDENYAAVCYRGIITAKKSAGDVSLGLTTLSVNSDGSITIGESGREIYIISYDNDTITFIF